jgi:hypothetical protein
MQKLKTICLAHAKNKKTFTFPVQEIKKLCPCKNNKTETAIQSQDDEEN